MLTRKPNVHAIDLLVQLSSTAYSIKILGEFEGQKLIIARRTCGYSRSYDVYIQTLTNLTVGQDHLLETVSGR